MVALLRGWFGEFGLLVLGVGIGWFWVLKV
jgi:hypothetical protein